MTNAEPYDAEIAIVGMSGRFPGANNVSEFWRNLCDGVESISSFTAEDLQAAGRDPGLLNNPDFVNAGGVLEGIDLFDASFFGINPREAEIIDPQQRLFLECAWQALEDAGYDPHTFNGPIGVYAGTNTSTYLFNLLSNPDLIALMGGFQVMMGNEKDYLTTQVSYRLNLKGPSVSIQTACSTSLVAVCMACDSLLFHQCDMALAGGVGIKVPQKTGYLYQEGMINSPDGHCRVFDAQAKGTVMSNGLGIVVLKRLTDAIADRDNIYAVIKGSAVNNDGALKVGFTAPSVEGQAEVIALAQSMAGIEPETITYVEAHGTGTPLGDPIEIAALNQAFRSSTNKQKFCRIGSVKSNIGHLNTAAGVAGLIKTALMLKHKMLPPSLHFTQPNPGIDFNHSPFVVNTELADWEKGTTPRRAGVSSFGIGGTNAHAVLEEAPAGGPPAPSRPAQLLLLSARTTTALDTATNNLVEYLTENPDTSFPDLVHTCQAGRRAFAHRRMLVCQDSVEARRVLSSLEPARVLSAQAGEEKPVAFMFPGQGAQYPNMARELYEAEPTFRDQVDFCCEILRPLMGEDLRQLLYPKPDDLEAAGKLAKTIFSQPALFVVEYALAQLWIEWGVQPSAMIGHSIGEYVAACLAGVFTLEEALSLVAERGRMMQQMPAGSMLAVALPEAEVRTFMNDALDLAAVNGDSLCVVSGPGDAVAQLEARLSAQSKFTRHLHTSHAFHSRMMQPLIEPFTALVKRIDLRPPRIPYISNVTGTWIKAEEVTDPKYWARHLRQTVLFAGGLGQLLRGAESILLEVGPGETLATLVRQHPETRREQMVVSSLHRPEALQSDEATMLRALGRLWLSGQAVNWDGFYKHESRRRVSLPPYPFERQRYWIEARRPAELATTQRQKQKITKWLYAPTWQRVPLTASSHVATSGGWLIFSDNHVLGPQLIQRLRQQGQVVVTVTRGDKFTRTGDNEYTIATGRSDDYKALIKTLQDADQLPSNILHLWSVTGEPQPSTTESMDQGQELGFYSLLYLAQALGAEDIVEPLTIAVISNDVHRVTGDERLQPEKATVLGPCKVIPQEFPNIRCRHIDLALANGVVCEALLDHLLAELAAGAPDTEVAYRSEHRWVRTFTPIRWEEALGAVSPLREGGTYLITGGLGGIGLALAQSMAQRTKAKLVLVGRTVMPPKESWTTWLGDHDERDPISQKIQAVQALETHGAEVLLISADVTRKDDLQAVVDQTYKRFGKIEGVIHAAGVAGGGMIQLKTPQMAASVLAPKLQGTLALAAALNIAELDFLILSSSLASILGGFGQVDYCGANAFLDAFANSYDGNGRVISINWDTWQEVGMAVETELPRDLKERRAEGLKQGILSAEGVEVFNRILQGGHAQIAVSTIDLPTRAQISNAPVASGPSETESRSIVSQPGHARPQLATSYVPARNQVEQTLANLWQRLLGVEQIGIYDDFFELGGHSLLAVRLMAEIEKELGRRIPLVSLFKNTTVAALADILQQDVDSLVWPTMVEIQSGDSKPPLVCVSTPNVNALGYRSLAHWLGPDQSVFGLQAHYPEDLDGEHSQAAVEQLASVYLAALRERQPTGPYQLVGLCRGAHIAYEMARTLEEDGEQVGLLAILDTWVLENTYNRFLYVEYYARRLRSFLRSGLKEQLRTLAGKTVGHRGLDSELSSNAANGGVPIRKNPMDAYFPGSNFVPRTYKGRITVFPVRRQPLNRIRDPQLGWGKLTSAGVEVHIIPGNHETVLREPSVRGLAEELKKCLLGVR